MKYAIILNPNSGSGRAAREWRRLEGHVRSILGAFSLFCTERPGHGVELTRRALHDGHDRIISAGGDGTNYEVVNGFFENDALINPNASMALLPIGTGSDLRRTLGLRRGLRAVPYLARHDLIYADMGRVNSTDASGRPLTHYFLNSLHIGLGGLVGEYVNRGNKRFGGRLTFFKGVVMARLAYKPQPMEIAINGDRLEGRFLDLIIANGQYDGGGMHVAPRARLDSGHFEVYVIGDVGLIGTALNLPRLYMGTLERHPRVRYYQASVLEVRSPEAVRVSPDGELAGHTPARVDILPRLLPLAVPHAP